LLQGISIRLYVDEQRGCKLSQFVALMLVTHKLDQVYRVGSTREVIL
jgi:hypothetical protein